MSKALKLEIEELISIHTQTKYRIYFLGFLPGFLYLEGLNKRLHFPRKENPILNVPKGAVGIGGKQTGIYPNLSPGGWHLIGNTPLTLFDIKQNPPCFASPGDWVSFTSIDQKTYQDLAKKIKKDKLDNLLKNKRIGFIKIDERSLEGKKPPDEIIVIDKLRELKDLISKIFKIKRSQIFQN